MIIGFLLNILYGFINLLVGYLPVGGSVPSTWISGIYSIWSYVNLFSFVVPVNTILSCLGIALVFHGFIFAWHGIHWVISLVRGYHY